MRLTGSTLATSISFALLGTLVPNLYKQTKTPRPHNRHKFVNEVLARHQLTYTTFFAAVALTAEFKTGFEWAKRMFGVALAFTLIFYFVGNYFSVHQDDLFIGHGCNEDGHCTKAVSFFDLLKLCKINLITSAILLITAVSLVIAIK